jgi:death on curing protein
MKYLSTEEILLLHFNVIQDYGGSHGVRDEGRVKSVVQAPKLEAFGEQQYKTVHKKAAVYLRNIIADHPFVDGNKRTGVTVTAIHLFRNGYALTAKTKELEDFAVKVAVNKLSIEDIAVWLKTHSKKQ